METKRARFDIREAMFWGTMFYATEGGAGLIPGNIDKLVACMTAAFIEMFHGGPTEQFTWKLTSQSYDWVRLSNEQLKALGRPRPHYFSRARFFHFFVQDLEYREEPPGVWLTGVEARLRRDCPYGWGSAEMLELLPADLKNARQYVGELDIEDRTLCEQYGQRIRRYFELLFMPAVVRHGPQANPLAN